MVSLNSGLYFVVIIVIVTHVSAQINEKYHYSANGRGTPDEDTSVHFTEASDKVTDEYSDEDEESNEIPLAVLMEVSQLSNMSEFIDRFVAKETIDPRDGILYSDVNDLQRSPGVKGITAGCVPKETAVHLEPDEKTKGNVMYYPSCVWAMRCGGCCGTSQLKCQPTQKEVINFEVAVNEYDAHGLFKYRGKINIPTEIHTHCNCTCQTTESDCNEWQVYKKDLCKCSCRNRADRKKCLKTKDRSWDSKLCRCQCKEIHECTTGTEFDLNTCSCLPIDRNDRRKFIVKPTVLNPN